MIPKYYEYLNKTKILSGYRAMDHIPHELEARQASRPMLIASQELIERGFVIRFMKSFGASEVTLGSIYPYSDKIGGHEERAGDTFGKNNCDSVIAMGNASALELGKCIVGRMNTTVPFIVVPSGSSGSEITGKPDVAVLDPRLSYAASRRETAAAAMDTLCHAIEAYTCLQKNPLSDAYAFSAINLVRQNLGLALKQGFDRHARLGLLNAALLSGAAFMNSQPGLVHGLAEGLVKFSGISHHEAVAILLPHCMDYQMIKFDAYYGELLLPLSGPEIYADTLPHERGRKMVQTLRHMLSEYHDKYLLPVCLSEIGIKRSDFDRIADKSINSRHMLYDPSELGASDIKNILSLAF